MRNERPLPNNGRNAGVSEEISENNAGVSIPELRDICPAVCLKINAV
jgi:hypothetical protein